jgi:WD40 repeat protein
VAEAWIAQDLRSDKAMSISAGREREAMSSVNMSRRWSAGPLAIVVSAASLCTLVALILVSSASAHAGAGELSRATPVSNLMHSHDPLIVADANGGKAADAVAPEVAKVIRHLKLKAGGLVVSWSPDGKLLAVMGIHERIMLCDPRTGDTIWEVAGERDGGGEALAFSSDGRLLLASTIGSTPEDQHATLALLDVSQGTVTGRVAAPFPNEDLVRNFARAITVDRKDGLMAIVTIRQPGRPVALYDMRDWTLKGTVVVEKETPASVAFGSDGRLAVYTIGGKVALFDAHTLTLERVIMTSSQLGAVAFSPDGKYLVASGDQPDRIGIWNAADGSLVRSYSNGSWAHGLAWSPDGRYVASAGLDRTIRLWPLAGDGVARIVATFNSGAAWSVAFSPDGKFLAGGGTDDGVIIAEIE